MLSTVLLPYAVLAGSIGSDGTEASATASGVPTDLLHVVPLETTSVWAWRSDAGTRPLEGQVEEVIDAIAAAEFDQFVFDAMGSLGVSEGVVTEARAVRNVLASVGGMVPWRELFANEVVYAETNLSALLPGTDMPGMLLACRPGYERVEDIETALSGMLGAVAGTLGFLRYDIHELEGPYGHATTRRYELVWRGDDGDTPLVQVAVRGGVVLIGMGDDYFDIAVRLLEGGERARLVDSARFQKAFEGLPTGAAGRSYVDVTRLMGDVDAIHELTAEMQFNSGLWQGFVNGAMDLAGTVETVASATHCSSGRMTVETMTRFDPASPRFVRAGFSEPASPRLLEYVPSDVASFEMRGDVDLVSTARWAAERWKSDWAPAEDILWLADVVQAVLGLSVEDDILSWIGAEHVSMSVPSSSGSNESVIICRVDDVAAVEKCLERVEGVFHAVAPRVLGSLQELLVEAQVPFNVDIQLHPGSRRHPKLRRLDVMAFPIVKNMVVGTVDGLFCFATSEEALDHCLGVAAGDVAGLFERDLANELVGRTDLSSVKLRPIGQEWAGNLEMVSMIAGWLYGVQEGMQDSPEGRLAVGLGLDLIGRVERVLETVDFLGDSITHGQARDGGLAQYEVTTTRLLLPAPPAPTRSELAGAVF